MNVYQFTGEWITDAEFADLEPRNVFHRQLEKVDLPCEEHRNRHILFRKSFFLDTVPEQGLLYISADDYYKVYLNGQLMGQGPAPAYHHHYHYNVLDVTSGLRPGINVLAVHTLYQGLINRVWVSGDLRHGLICDLVADGKVIAKSNRAFRTHPHSGYREIGTVGYKTQFLEHYDSTAPEVGFFLPDFDDSRWEFARIRKYLDCQLVPQTTKMLELETVLPQKVTQTENALFIDFGSCYVGYLQADAIGPAGSEVTVLCGQELLEDGNVRHKMRCNCDYRETWALSGKKDSLDWFDYKAFRYVQLILPAGCRVENVSLIARHYPFRLNATLQPRYAHLQDIWDLCVHTQQYGVQEVIQDCMEREKGFYLGDGCYTALAHMILSGDDSMARRLIDDAFLSTFITPGMMTCLSCAFMQEIAEYPMMLISLILWHYRLTGDKAYLAQNYPGVCKLLDSYREEYEKDGLLQELTKWCVVEWPANFRDGYDVNLKEGQVCHEPHVALNAYYLEAIRCANWMAEILGQPLYRDRKPLEKAFIQAFYDPQRNLFRDSDRSQHVSYIGNVLAYAFCLFPEEAGNRAMEAWMAERGITGVGIFGAFPYLCGLVRHGQQALLDAALSDPGAWRRMLREGATTVFEGWGKDTKKNASLFHLTLSYAAVFLAEIDGDKLLSVESLSGNEV